MVTCRECGAELPDDARFCIECSAPVVSDGSTTRLEQRPIADGATERLEPLDLLGFFRGEPVYEYSWELWCHPEFYAINPLELEWIRLCSRPSS